jgi:predicted transcriptional regulator of viral defense system
MSAKTLMAFIKELNKSVFTTAELVAVSGKSASVVSQGLNFLQSQGLTFKVYHGIWSEGKTPPDPYSVIKYLFPKQRVYVSFTSALHLHSIIEQIPQTITLASVAHTRKIKTAAGVFFIHHIEPSFFFGFDWKSDELDFLLAEPEKAMADCLYISAHKKNQFSAFPELHFPKKFSFDKIESYLKKIKNENVVVYALKRLEKIKREHWKNKKKAI